MTENKIFAEVKKTHFMIQIPAAFYFKFKS